MTKKSQLTSVLYDGHSIPEILDLYIELLKGSNDIEDISHANKLTEYRKLITNKKFLSKIRKNFNSIYSMIASEYPNLHFNLEGRRKSLLSTEKKILRLQSKNKSLESLRDLFGFRIIIFDNSEELCYNLMEKIIEFNAKRGFILCEADSKTDISEDCTSESSPFLAKYQYGIKDYIATPKKNGYQSLHAIFQDSERNYFEVQIRTKKMHEISESGDACHQKYKDSTDITDLEMTIDRTRISIPKYSFSVENDLVSDNVGLEKSYLILQKEKTF